MRHFRSSNFRHATYNWIESNDQNFYAKTFKEIVMKEQQVTTSF